ncbi:hypothetical protein G5V59_00130 [Nocardioides sp. W3-2-3]|uniref:hypothetical protein n=1 Tax=Nocardioides convexus TaxID=2712224 RepID=UPI00241844B0|nr:hypothetical protein [Nocardioides convexus]NGZ99381.1 hypothetical protein [Nocardioides convexus]
MWVDLAPGTMYGPDPVFGILIERRPRSGKHGSTTWEGFVLTGAPPDERRGASVKAEWYPFSCLTLVDAPRPPKRGRPPGAG